MTTTPVRTLVARITVLIIIATGCLSTSPASACKCFRSTIDEYFGSADTIVETQVVRVNHAHFRMFWCRLRALFGSDLEDYVPSCGIRVKLNVLRTWKGK